MAASLKVAKNQQYVSRLQLPTCPRLTGLATPSRSSRTRSTRTGLVLSRPGKGVGHEPEPGVVDVLGELLKANAGTVRPTLSRVSLLVWPTIRRRHKCRDPEP